MIFNILTIFPEILKPYFEASLLGRAQKAGLLKINLLDIRKFAIDKHHTTDDTPYGGGAGMVMKIEPIHRALKSLRVRKGQKNSRILLTSAKGETLTQKKAGTFSKLKKLTIICGRYEGVDERVAKHLCDTEISIGDYVLAGGELPAAIITEATARLIPGVLGNPDSLAEESFISSPHGVSMEYPQYTKPDAYNSWSIPKILLSGNHQKIAAWRKKTSHQKNQKTP